MTLWSLQRRFAQATCNTILSEAVKFSLVEGWGGGGGWVGVESLHGSERGADAGLEFVERRSERQEVALDDSRQDSQEHQPGKTFSDAIGQVEIVKGLEFVMVEAKKSLERAGPMPGLSRTFVFIHGTRTRLMKTSRDSPWNLLSGDWAGSFPGSRRDGRSSA